MNLFKGKRIRNFTEELMYSEWPKDLPVLAEAPWNRCCETQSELLEAGTGVSRHGGIA